MRHHSRTGRKVPRGVPPSPSNLYGLDPAASKRDRMIARPSATSQPWYLRPAAAWTAEAD